MSNDQVWKLDGTGMRLHVPAPDHRFHYLPERHAARPRIESDDKQAIITWARFASQRMDPTCKQTGPDSEHKMESRLNIVPFVGVKAVRATSGLIHDEQLGPLRCRRAVRRVSVAYLVALPGFQPKARARST